MQKQLINIEPVKDEVRQKLLEKYDSTLYMNTTSIDVKLDIKDIIEEHIKQKNLIEPQVYITTEAYIKMRTLVDDTSTEIGWYGTVTEMPGLDQVFVIEDILVYPQKVTGVTCEQDDDKIFEFEMSLSNEQVNRKRFHGHSHVNMGTSPSGVDEQFYQDILSQVTDYFIITITNKHNSYTTRFYDMRNNILYTDVPIKVLFNNGTTKEQWYKEVETKLSKPTYTPTYTAPSTFKTTEHTDKYYSAKEQAENFKKKEYTFKNKAHDHTRYDEGNDAYAYYCYDEDGDPWYYHEVFGYIKESELDELIKDGKPKLETHKKPGRPKKKGKR